MKRYGAVFFQPVEPQPAVTSHQSSAISDAQTLAFELAGAFSPWVEMAGPNLALMDLSGLTKQWPEEKNLADAIQKKFEEQDLRAQVAIASNQITARLAALGYAGTSIVPPGQEKQFLAP
ncbi:MAG TPA: hypothetical protein VGQ81_03435, partial [Acidobacteriota bacterium]|nr:hypothetical protein [Acidobacteriota bacterium]